MVRANYASLPHRSLRSADLSTTVVLTLARSGPRCTKEEEEEAAERSRGEAREARHGALIGRAEPRRVHHVFAINS